MFIQLQSLDYTSLYLCMVYGLCTIMICIVWFLYLKVCVNFWMILTDTVIRPLFVDKMYVAMHECKISLIDINLYQTMICYIDTLSYCMCYLLDTFLYIYNIYINYKYNINIYKLLILSILLLRNLVRGIHILRIVIYDICIYYTLLCLYYMIPIYAISTCCLDILSIHNLYYNQFFIFYKHYYDLKFFTNSNIQNQIYQFCHMLRPIENLIMHKKITNVQNSI